MRLSTNLAALTLAAGLTTSASAQEADQQMRQQIEIVHMKWLEALNKGDVDAFLDNVHPDYHSHRRVRQDDGRQNGICSGVA